MHDFFSSTSSDLKRMCRMCSLYVFFAMSAAFVGCADCQDSSSSSGEDTRLLDSGMDLGGQDTLVDQDAFVDMDVDAGGNKDMDVDMRMRPDIIVPPWDFGNNDDASLDAFALDAIVPPSGPLIGGTRVRIKGSLLMEGTRVFFGGHEVEVSFGAQGLIARTPPGRSDGPVTVKAIAPDGQIVALDGGFTYLTPLRVDTIFPERVPTTGGVEVALHGDGFHPNMGASFDGASAYRVDVISEHLARLVVPARDRAGFVDLRLTTIDDVFELEEAVTYFESLMVDEVTPASIPTAGGVEVVLRGKGFDGSTQVMMDGQAVPIVSVNATQDIIVVRAPAHAPGLVDVTVHNNALAFRLDGAVFYRGNDTPVVAAVRPAVGPDEGGASVTLIGSGFDDPKAEVFFDSMPAALLTSSPFHATVTLPPHHVGYADVVLRHAGVEVARLVQGFEYKPTIWLDAITPNHASEEGGVEVVLTGRGLQHTTRVLFGGLPAQIVSTTPTELRVVAPVHTAGVVDVKVEGDVLTTSLFAGFTYNAPLAIWGFTPTRGSIAGRTYVAVRGTGLDDALEVVLGGLPALRVRRIDAHNLYFYTPPRVRGESMLEIKRATERVEAPYPFEYFNPATRFGGAAGEHIKGAINVSVFATGGSPLEQAFVMLSTRADTRYQGFTDANGQLTLSGPDVLGAQTVTATAAGFSTTSVQTVDAENVTIFLNPLEPNPGQGSGEPLPFGTIRGDVRMLGKLADPGNEKTYDMAVVSTTRPGLLGGNPNSGPGGLVLGEGRYEINTRIGDMAVIALCGVFDEGTDSFVPQYMGVERFVFVSDRGEYEVDLLCDIPLDQEIQVKLVNPIYNPTGPDTNRVSVIWDFGFEGFFSAPVQGSGLDALITIPKQPARLGPLADISFTLIGGSYTGQHSPLTETSVSNVQDISKVILLPPLLDVPEPVAPLSGGVISDRVIRWEVSGPYPPDMIILQLRNIKGIPVWNMIVPGTQSYAHIPEFPDFSAQPLAQRPNPLSQEQLFLTIRAIRIPEFLYSSFTYQDLGSSHWEAYALNRWTVQLPLPRN